MTAMNIILALAASTLTTRTALAAPGDIINLGTLPGATSSVA